MAGGGPLPEDERRKPTSLIVAVQICAASGYAAHVTKILQEPRAADWIRAGGCLQVWAWRPQPKGTRAGKYLARVAIFGLLDDGQLYVAATSEQGIKP